MQVSIGTFGNGGPDHNQITSFSVIGNLLAQVRASCSLEMPATVWIAYEAKVLE